MYGGRSANSNLSKILGHSPLIHKKTTIPISPTKNSEIRTTSSVLLDHISTKVSRIIYFGGDFFNFLNLSILIIFEVNKINNYYLLFIMH